jgi:hypothetical protein
LISQSGNVYRWILRRLLIPHQSSSMKRFAS